MFLDEDSRQMHGSATAVRVLSRRVYDGRRADRRSRRTCAFVGPHKDLRIPHAEVAFLDGLFCRLNVVKISLAAVERGAQSRTCPESSAISSAWPNARGCRPSRSSRPPSTVKRNAGPAMCAEMENLAAGSPALIRRKRKLRRRHRARSLHRRLPVAGRAARRREPGARSSANCRAI